MPRNNEELLHELIKKYARLYMKMAKDKGIPFDDVEDIVMDAFWSFYRSKHFGMLSETETKAMMTRIVENKCIDWYRKNKRAQSNENIDEMEFLKAPSEDEPLQKAVSDEGYQDIIRCMEEMKKSWRDVAVMYWIEGLSVSEICERLGITGDVCRSRITKARQYLKKTLKDRLGKNGHSADS